MGTQEEEGSQHVPPGVHVYVELEWGLEAEVDQKTLQQVQIQ